MDDIAFVSDGNTLWLSSDNNGDRVWNYSHVGQSGGSTIQAGNQWGDIPMDGPGRKDNTSLRININHIAGGYAGIDIPTGAPAGTEPVSWDIRNQGKDVGDSVKLLRFYIKAEERPPLYISLTDAHGTESRAQMPFYSYAFPTQGWTRVVIPAGYFGTDEGPELDWSRIQTVNIFCDLQYDNAAISVYIDDIEFVR